MARFALAWLLLIDRGEAIGQTWETTLQRRGLGKMAACDWWNETWCVKEKGVKVTWISALEIPEEFAEMLNGVLEDRSRGTRDPASTLLEAVGQAFGVDVAEYMPFLKGERGMGNPPSPRLRRTSGEWSAAEAKTYLELSAAAQFYYRNYQDESLYATAARYLANGVRPCAWEPSVKAAVEHYDRYGGRGARRKPQHREEVFVVWG